METYFLNGDFKIISVTDSLISCKVVKRFFSAGDFTLTVPASVGIRSAAEYFLDPNSGFCGIIESRSVEDGVLTVSGRSLEALLERRIIYGGGIYSGNVESAVRTAVEQNAIKKRPLSNLTLGSAAGLVGDGYLETAWMDLSGWIYSSLRSLEASYSVTLDSVTGGLVFRVEKKRDRTRSSSSPVVFSESLGNIEELKISADTSDEKNVAYVRGSDGTCAVAGSVELEGTIRRETFVSAADIFPERYAGHDAYVAALVKRGNEKLALMGGNYKASGVTIHGPQFGRDYLLGDVCEIEAESGLSFSAMVTSVTYVYTGGEAVVYPAFGDDEKTLRRLVQETLDRRA